MEGEKGRKGERKEGIEGRTGGTNLTIKEKPSWQRQPYTRAYTLSGVCGHFPRDQSKPQCAGCLETTAITERRNRAYKFRSESCFLPMSSNTSMWRKQQAWTVRLWICLMLLDIFWPFLLLALCPDLISYLLWACSFLKGKGRTVLCLTERFILI